MIALIYETELYTRWLPFCRHSNLIKDEDKCTKITQLIEEVPIVTDREVLLIGMGIDRMKINSTFLITAKTVDKNKAI